MKYALCVGRALAIFNQEELRISVDLLDLIAH